MVESIDTSKKHQKLVKDKDGGVEQVEIKAIHKNIRNKIDSPFINQQKDWENEDYFQIPKDLLKGITDALEFKKPSKIQAVAIPMIVKKNEEGKYDNLIA